MYPAFSDDGSSGFLNNGEALLEMKSQQFLKIFSNWWSQLNIRHPDEVETFHGLEINKKVKKLSKTSYLKVKSPGGWIFEMNESEAESWSHIPDSDLWDGEMSKDGKCIQVQD